VLRFADKRKHALHRVLPRWDRVLRIVGGSTWRLSDRLGPDIGPRHQERVLRRWSARTLQVHVANIEKFLDWASEERPGVDHDSFQDHEATVELLVRYVMDLLDGGAAPTMPAARLESLRFLNRAAGLAPPLPAGEVCVRHLALAHRREAPGSARLPKIYTADQIRKLERAATALRNPLDRVVIRTELRKLFAALRNDDAVWDKFGDWLQEGSAAGGCLYGTAYKTKATEATSTRLRGGMPWIAPLRGVCQPPSGWAHGYSADLKALGLPEDAEFAVPSPQRISAAATPGAAEPDEWVVAIRRALRAAGLSPLEAKGIGLHSAKRTILTWAGSSGIFTDRELEVLGHHRSAGIGKVVCAYNVTVLAAPVTKLRQLLEHIVHGAFNPDAPAGMQWREGTYPVGQPASPAPAAAPSHTAPGPPANASAAASADGQASTGAAPTPQPALARSNQSAAQPPAHAAAAAQVHSPTGRAPLDHAAPPSVPHPVESRALVADAAALPPAAATAAPGAAEASPGGSQPPANKLGYLVAESTGLCKLVAYYHAAIPTEPPCLPAERPRTRRRKERLVVETPSGPVTNLCDFVMVQAKWSLQPPGPAYVICKVCNSRLLRRN